MATQIIRLGPGETIILPPNAIVTSVTSVNGGTAESECPLPNSSGTDTYYYFIDENPAAEGDQQWFFEKLIIGSVQTIFPVGTKPAEASLPSYTQFTDTVKSNPAILELRVKNYSGTDNKAFSIKVPKGSPVPYFLTYFTNDGGPWYFRYYHLETSDPNYATTVADLANPSTII